MSALAPLSLARAALRSPRAFAAVAFLASRVFYRLVVGIELDVSPVHYFLQFLDPYFLQTDLTRSVLALHHQAPLINLLLGVCMKLFGDGAFIAMDVVFVALGLAAAVGLADVLTRLGASPPLAIAGACLFSLSPVVVIYEGWLFYPHVVSSTLIIAASLLLRFVRLESTRSGLAFFAALAVVGLVRSTYGPLWFGSVLLILLWLRPVARRTLLKAAALPLFVMLLHSAKTPLYVGHGYGEAILWPNLAKKVFMTLPRGEARRLRRKKAVSPAVTYEAFSDLRAMPEVRVPHPPTGIPALDDANGPFGRPNANALEHVLIAERYYKPDALFLLRRYPGTYARSCLDALLVQYPRSPLNDVSLSRSENYQRLEGADKALKVVAVTQKRQWSPVVSLLLLIGLGSGLSRAFGARSRLASSRSSRAFAAFALFTILYTTAVTVLISWGDFPRYRYEVDGLYWVLIVLAAGSLLAAARARWARWRGKETRDPQQDPR